MCPRLSLVSDVFRSRPCANAEAPASRRLLCVSCSSCSGCLGDESTGTNACAARRAWHMQREQ